MIKNFIVNVRCGLVLFALCFFVFFQTPVEANSSPPKQVFSKASKIVITGSDSESVIDEKGSFLFVEKSGEFFGSVIEFFSSVSSDSEMITKQNSSQKCNHTESWVRDYINKQIVHCFYIFLFMFLWMIVLAKMLLTIWHKIF